MTADDKVNLSPSPPPQTQLMCCVHNRKRTKRNLMRADGGKWQCTPKDPCLTGGERKGGAKGGGRGGGSAGRSGADDRRGDAVVRGRGRCRSGSRSRSQHRRSSPR